KRNNFIENQPNIFQFETLKRIRTKNGQNMVFITLNDALNNIEGAVFLDAYKKLEIYLNDTDTLIVKGKFENRNNKKQLIINQIENDASYENNKLANAKQIIIRNIESSSEKKQWLDSQETADDIRAKYYQKTQN